VPATIMTPATTKKISLNLSEEATETVRELATSRGVSVSDVIREAIALYRFLYRKLRSGAEIDLVNPDGSRERVHFVFAP
jgi:Arc/MetJ-type ribon-helix-helix transcriptional regulator